MDREQKVVPFSQGAWQYETPLMSSREGYSAESHYCLYIIISVTELFIKKIRKQDLNLPCSQVYIHDKRGRESCMKYHSTWILQFYTARIMKFIHLYYYYFLLINRLFISLDFQRMRVWLCKSFWIGGESCVKREKTGSKSCTTLSKESQPHRHPLVKSQHCWRR